MVVGLAMVSHSSTLQLSWKVQLIYYALSAKATAAAGNYVYILHMFSSINIKTQSEQCYLCVAAQKSNGLHTIYTCSGIMQSMYYNYIYYNISKVN